MNTALMFATGKDDWQTPPDVFAPLYAEFEFTLDVAADQDNRQCFAYFNAEDNALGIEWSLVIGSPPVCWCNPPYSRGLQSRFIAKAAYERTRGVTTVMLLPARTDTKAFHEHIWDLDRHKPREGIEVRFLKGRLRFVGAHGPAPFPSMIVVFRGVQVNR